MAAHDRAAMPHPIDGDAMLQHILRRLLAIIPVLLLVSATVFSLIHLTPGDPAEIMAGEARDPEVVAGLRRDLGLDKPIHVQYAIWLGRAARGDLGKSIRTRQPVMEAVLERLKPTLQLSALAMALSMAIAFPAGIVSATRPESRGDISGTLFALLGVSMPNFLLALTLIFVFAVTLRWLPTSGYVDPFEDPISGIKSLVLPAVTLGTAMAAVVTRMVRSSLLEVLEQDYVRTARAKGLREQLVVLRHALKNALIPVVTIVGLQTGNLIGGAVITEYVFCIPGVGRLVVDSIFSKDYPLVQGVVLLTSLAFILANLAADVVYGYLDPRIRYG
jgi:peptide/nickel transport system permease protein